MDFTYLQPPRQAFKLKKLKQDQFQIIDGKPYRKIYENVKYNDQQLQNINNVKQYLKQKQPNKLYQDSFLLKIIYLTSSGNPIFNLHNIYENIKKHQEWFQNPLITGIRDKGRQILQEGVFYSYGRDNQYSPVVYCYPCMVDIGRYDVVDYYNALEMLLAPIQQHMLIPGINEGINVVINMQSKPHFNNLPFTTVKEMIQKVVFAYPYRLKRLFFINTSPNNQLIKCLKQTLKYYNYQQKPQFITRYQQFRKYIPDQEREQKYGGSLENLNEYWPISLATKYQQEKSYFLVDNSSETDYKSVMNEDVFFQGLEAGESYCGNYCGKKNCAIY